MKPGRSKLLDALYGEHESERVYQMLESLDPTLNNCVQAIAYDHFWALEGLSLRDKSMVTLVTLIVLEKEPQIRPHIIGFLNAGGTSKELTQILLYLIKNFNSQLAAKAFLMLGDLLQQTDFSELQNYFNNKVKNFTALSLLSNKDQRIVDLAANVAGCRAEGIRESMMKFLEETECNESMLRRVLVHQIVYCGFPAVINAFSVLKVSDIY